MKYAVFFLLCCLALAAAAPAPQYLTSWPGVAAPYSTLPLARTYGTVWNGYPGYYGARLYNPGYFGATYI